MSDQHYLVTARKYRPQVFADLVAQDHVSETLKNAIRLNRLAHLYLFSGPRGVGKTTAARILAKAINCTAPAEERVDGTEPCRACESCRAFEEGRSLSIFEIDAASNNKAEDMRELRETVRIPPQGGKRKVYIVDEVHMLSTAAFNVLLKTLEEPPPYVLFIFATTEPHKVLPTILSRCQRFDFKRIAVEEIVSRLEAICREESIKADDASLMLIARRGDGALRDALSVFDQAVALCGDTLEYDELARALGVVDIDHFFAVTDAARAHDAAAMLRLVDEIVRSGHDFQEFLGGLAEHLRGLLVAVTTGQAALIEGIETVRERYMAAAGDFSEQDLLRMLLIVADAESAIRGSTQPRLRLEIALLKIAAMTSAVDLRAVLSGAPLPEKAQPGEAPPQPPRRAPEATSTQQIAPRDEPQRTPPPASSEPEDVSPPSATSRPSPPLSAPPTPGPGASSPAGPPEDVRTRVFSKPALQVRRRPSPDDPQATITTGDGTDLLVAEPETVVSVHTLRSAWEAVGSRIGEERVRLGTLIRQATPTGAEAGRLTLEVPTDYHRQELEGAREDILAALGAALERPFTELRCVIAEAATSDDAVETAAAADPYEYLMRKRDENDVLRSLFEDFGGEYAP